jgi:hypothetical protein
MDRCFPVDAVPGALIRFLKIVDGLNVTTRRGRDRHFLTSPGITAHALAFLAHDKQAERRQLSRFAMLQAVRDFFEHMLNECRAFGSRQSVCYCASSLQHMLLCSRPNRPARSWGYLHMEWIRLATE